MRRFVIFVRFNADLAIRLKTLLANQYGTPNRKMNSYVTEAVIEKLDRELSATPESVFM